MDAQTIIIGDGRNDQTYIGSLIDPDSMQPMVLGITLLDNLNALINSLNVLVEEVRNHNHPTGVGPSGPAILGPTTGLSDFAYFTRAFHSAVGKIAPGIQPAEWFLLPDLGPGMGTGAQPAAPKDPLTGKDKGMTSTNQYGKTTYDPIDMDLDYNLEEGTGSEEEKESDQLDYVTGMGWDEKSDDGTSGADSSEEEDGETTGGGVRTWQELLALKAGKLAP
jgi:hypothetical protein